MNGVIKSMIAGGLKRRIFASFDRSVSPEAVNGNPCDTLLAVQKFLQLVSKSVGFKQIILASVGPVDIAEVCIYEPSNQPGIRPVYALYPAKAYRIYVAQYLAGENLSDYVHVDSRTSTQLALSEDRLRQPSSISLTSQQSQDLSRTQDQYSYGARLRQLEEDLVMAMAFKESEQSYLEEHGEDEIIQQQALADSLATRTDSRKSLVSRVTNKDLPHAAEYLDQLVDKQTEILRETRVASGRSDVSDETSQDEEDEENQNTNQRIAVQFFGSSGVFDRQITRGGGMSIPAASGSSILSRIKLGIKRLRSRFSTA